ncbi:uncharacterized protein LAJ45_08205 [Morchella importuna]|uniref:uncharacterized protein n=1 Tax=Morchella importuna TaxID=1174673 RepID=UPI001E8E4FD0|nr:uncharacterized protein LAJ45_08205 [Morchella importuna]KAH8147740.1 hypothetical protein LAJ45_08205 [Morchella importuna]
MLPKSIESSSPAILTVIIPATINRRPTGDNGYSLQRFLTACPDEDANVIFARRAVRESFPGTVTQAPPQPPVNEATREIPLRPYASATWMLANSIDVQPQQALETSRFQATGAGIISPTLHRNLSAATHTLHPEPEVESLGFSLRTFLATNPVDDANASYGRIVLNETPQNYCPLTQILEDFEDVIGFDGKVGRRGVSCEEEEGEEGELPRVRGTGFVGLLPSDKSLQHSKNETPGPGPSKSDCFF